MISDTDFGCSLWHWSKKNVLLLFKPQERTPVQWPVCLLRASSAMSTICVHTFSGLCKWLFFGWGPSERNSGQKGRIMALSLTSVSLAPKIGHQGITGRLQKPKSALSCGIKPRQCQHVWQRAQEITLQPGRAGELEVSEETGGGAMAESKKRGISPVLFRPKW